MKTHCWAPRLECLMLLQGPPFIKPPWPPGRVSALSPCAPHPCAPLGRPEWGLFGEKVVSVTTTLLVEPLRDTTPATSTPAHVGHRPLQAGAEESPGAP